MALDEQDVLEAMEDLLQKQRAGRITLEEAALRLKRRWRPEDFAVIDDALQRLKDAARRNRRLEIPPGLNASYTQEEERQASWYTGPAAGDRLWPSLAASLRGKFSAEDFESLDRASTKVVANLADPHVVGLKKRGLVLGYVQSGKTANYTSVIAKSADAGYRFVVVLAGMYNNLRRQTQRRLLSDLGSEWVQLTDEEADFGRSFPGQPLLANSKTRILAVVKKNSKRLDKLKKWLRDIPIECRETCPVLLLDDEADQATPNSKAARDEVSAINHLLKDIWQLIPTGSYVGYTATPFANIFMNPDDEEDLYPADFVVDLPRPKAYFGAERLFGSQELDDPDDPRDDGIDVVRVIPDDDSTVLIPTKPISGYEAVVPPSLMEAMHWFVIATATRRARGQRDHSSMLIHTTHYVEPHFAMQAAIKECVAELRESVDSDDTMELEALWLKERDRAACVRSTPLPAWPAVLREIPGTLADCRVIVDNGSSDERLDYGEFNADGSERRHTVIAIGGGTLSRGLTLEGLVVSYFNRTSNTYDTLLQMGRWFGYRPGYEDLQRIWATAQLRDDFEFLGIVEAEIRQEIRNMELQQKTPRELALKVRAHPGRLEITARAKMYFASEVALDYSGSRGQTFILHEQDLAVLEANETSARRLLASAQEFAPCERGLGQVRRLWRGIPNSAVVQFMNAYRTHEDQQSLRAEVVSNWLEAYARDCRWNVGLASGPTSRADVLGVIDLGVDEPIPMLNRAPLLKSQVGTANIKTLRSAIDQVADLGRDVVEGRRAEEYPTLRREHLPTTGLIVLYPISHKSVPISHGSNSRRAMRALRPLIGYSIVFPVVSGATHGGASYWAVTPSWEPDLDDLEELLPDKEADMPHDRVARRIAT